MKYQVSERAYSKVNNAVLISGSARSGTTIIGKVLHSLEGVEYAFEPPALFSIFPLIDQLPEDHWKLLYETYLYEDFFINSICGRGINCNQSDDSSIYNVKSPSFISDRLGRSLGKSAAEEISKNYTLALKIPDITPYLPALINYYSGTRVVIMLRDAVGTLNSLMAKKWFSDELIDQNLIWPFRLFGNNKIPYWVRENEEDKWLRMTEIDRCAYYYIRVNESIKDIPNRIEIKYRALVDSPRKVIEYLASELNLNFGEKTQEIISTIQLTNNERDKFVVNKISPNMVELVEYYSSIS